MKERATLVTALRLSELQFTRHIPQIPVQHHLHRRARGKRGVGTVLDQDRRQFRGRTRRRALKRTLNSDSAPARSRSACR